MSTLRRYSRGAFGFGTPDSPHRLLAISDDWPHEFAHYKLTNADVFNRMIAQGAVRFAYGSKNDAELAQKIKAWRLG